MKPNNTVAVSIPIHDWTPHLKAVLGSLKAQSADLELAVMMTNEDPKILEDLENSGLELHYTRIGPDAGQAAAIKEGWANTDGAILAWLNTDDALTGDITPGVIEAFADDPDLDLFYGGSTISDEHGIVLGLHPAVEPLGPLLRRTNIISQPSCFFRRQAVDAIGGINPKLQYTMDWDLWLRLYENDSKFHFSDQILSNVTWASQTKTASLNLERLREFGKVLRRTQSLYSTAKGLYSVVRSNNSTYKDDEQIGANCKPFTATHRSTTLPIINMHSTSKTQLHINHEDKDMVISTNDSAAKISTKANHTAIKFSTGIEPGKIALLTVKGNSATIHKLRWL